jgi:uncharacterized protein YfiM (DUF2279 family)
MPSRAYAAIGILLFAGLARIESASAQAFTPAAFDSTALVQKKLNHDGWFGKDKFDHAMTSAGLVAAQFYFLHQELEWKTSKSRQFAAGSALLGGIAKEIYDKASRRGTPSWKDLLADLIGVGVAVVLITHS